MEAILTSLNWEQLGASGFIIALLLWLYKDERNDRKLWQQKAFDISEAAQREMASSAQVLDRTVAALSSKND